MQNSRLHLALSYANWGWHVFPLQAQSKVPATAHGFKDATLDPDQIHAWWGARPDYNIGIATGRISGFWVVDVDNRNQGDSLLLELMHKNSPFPSTVESITGNGMHYLFRYPPTASIPSCVLDTGIDIKSDGGYIVAPGSIHPNGHLYGFEASSDPTDGVAIVDAPDWLLARVVRQHQQGAAHAIAIPRNQYVHPDTLRELESALQFIPADNYKMLIRIGLALYSMGNDDEGFRLWNDWAKGKCSNGKYNPAHMGEKWRSFQVRTDINKETVFYEAQQRGWVNQSSSWLGQQPAPIELLELAENKTGILDAVDEDSNFQFDIKPFGFLKPVYDYIVATAPVHQPVLALNAAISLAAVIMGRKIQSPTGLRSNLYLNTLAESGSGKGHAMKVVSKILRETGRSHLIGGSKIASGSALFNRAASQPNTLFLLDEFGKMLDGVTGKNGAIPEYKRAIIGNLLELYGRTDEVITGTEYADQSIARQDIEYPCININAVTTPDTFFDAIDARSIEDGFLNRFITCPIPTGLEQSDNDDAYLYDIPNDIIQQIGQVEKLLEGRGNLQRFTGDNPVMATQSDIAQQLFREFKSSIKQHKAQLQNTGFDLMWQRSLEHAIKLAMIVAVGDLSLEIQERHAAWAINFVEFWNKRFIQVAQQRISDGQFHAIEQDVYRLICKAGKRGMTLRELAQSSRKFRAAGGVQRMQVIGWLVTSKQVAEHQVMERRKAYVPLAQEEA